MHTFALDYEIYQDVVKCQFHLNTIIYHFRNISQARMKVLVILTIFFGIVLCQENSIEDIMKSVMSSGQARSAFSDRIANTQIDDEQLSRFVLWGAKRIRPNGRPMPRPPYTRVSI